MTVALGYFQSPAGNVGDDLNPWLAPLLLPEVRFGRSDTVLIGIGSILVSGRWDGYARKIVAGAGARSAERLPCLDASWDIRCVRGPQSVEAIAAGGGTCPIGIADPAILISRFVAPAARRRGIGIVPHYQSGRRVWRALATLCGAELIWPHLPVETFLARAGRCDFLLCEAMHGAILADALRIPWAPVAFQNRRAEGSTHAFKWLDWCRSMELPFVPLELPLNALRVERATRGALRASADQAWHILRCAALIRSYVQNGPRYRSDPTLFADRADRLADVFARLNRELRGA